MMKQKVDHMNPPGANMVARVGRMRSEMTIAQVVGHVVIWLIVTMITFGIGAFFWPYATAKLIIESIVITDEFGGNTARPRCAVKFGEQVGHALLWLILIVVTGGIAAPFYLFAVAHIAIGRSELVSA